MDLKELKELKLRLSLLNENLDFLLNLKNLETLIIYVEFFFMETIIQLREICKNLNLNIYTKIYKRGYYCLKLKE